MKKPKWSDSEELFLRDNCHRGISFLMAHIPRTWAAIHVRATVIGVHIPRVVPYDVSMGELPIKVWLWKNRILPRLVANGACLEWLRSNKCGYGGITAFFGSKRKILQTHRVALEVSVGRILSKKEFALHRCDNPKCNNPSHLFVGSAHDNTIDMMRKNRNGGQFKKGHRACFGEQHGNSLLTERSVIEIRKLSSEQKVKPSDLADRFGVSVGAITGVLRGATWRHLK